MSADNGIYILETAEGECRVIHTQAIDNLYWSFLTKSSGGSIVPTRVIHYYGNSKPMTKNEARQKAFEMEEEILHSDFPILEYGISTISCKSTWKEIEDEAKILAQKEIDIIKSNYQDDGRWDYDIKYLEEIIKR